MIPWTFAAALTMPTMFAATGWQVRRLVGDQTWSDALMWITIVVGIASAICVLGWIWCDALEALEVASRGVATALIAAVSAWTFVTVLNIRMTTGRRRNPLIATLAWPAAAGAIWWIADHIVADASVRGAMLGFAGYLAVGALIQLCSTLAVTEACRAMSLACRHEADHPDMLVGRRPTPDALRQGCRPRHETVAGR